MNRYGPRVWILASLASLAPLSGGAAKEIPREPGVWWEQTIEMQMPGFSMPGQTTKVCMPKRQWDGPPVADEDEEGCRITEAKRSGSRMTWKVKCKDGSSGSGDMTQLADSFSGTMTMNRDGAVMNMKMKGRKLGGDCDANENERKVAEIREQVAGSQAEMARGQAQQCEEAVREMNLDAFIEHTPGLPVGCPDRKAAFCTRFETLEGFVAVNAASMGDEGQARAQAAKLCKKDLAKLEPKLCEQAAKEPPKGKQRDPAAVDFMAARCPDQMKAIAKRECAGRSFTDMGPNQREFCVKFARKQLDDGGRKGAPASGEPQGARESEGGGGDEPSGGIKSKVMKGLFGR